MDKLSGNEHVQIINYLKASGLEVGLLTNFGAKSLEHKSIRDLSKVFNLKKKSALIGVICGYL